MTLKKIISVIAACSFMVCTHTVYSQYFGTTGDDNAISASYDDLNPEQQHRVNNSFIADENMSDERLDAPSYERDVYPDRKIVTQTKKRPVKIKNRIRNDDSYDDQLPRRILTTERVIIVDPVIHKWAAYASDGKLLRAGLATAGAKWCSDIGRPCKTKAGTFRIYSLGDGDCISSKYPINEGGGAPMPYCMYFNGSQGLHGSNQVVAGNISHGCVRLRESDARWLRYNFSTTGTKVIIKPY